MKQSGRGYVWDYGKFASINKREREGAVIEDEDCRKRLKSQCCLSSFPQSALSEVRCLFGELYVVLMTLKL